MKKLSTVMAFVILLVSCVCITVSADTEAVNTLKVTAVSGDVIVGEELTLTVSFSENTGFNTLGVKLTYPEGFTYVDESAAPSALIAEKCQLNYGGYSGETYTFNVDTTARTITFIGASLYDITEASGTLFTAKFTATAATKGAAFKVEVVDDPYNEGGDTVTVTPESGSVNAYKLGDVTMDGRINGFDAMKILQHASKIITLTDQEMQLANVHTAISAVNGFDAMMVLQYASKLISW